MFYGYVHTRPSPEPVLIITPALSEATGRIAYFAPDSDFPVSAQPGFGETGLGSIMNRQFILNGNETMELLFMDGLHNSEMLLGFYREGGSVTDFLNTISFVDANGMEVVLTREQLNGNSTLFYSGEGIWRRVYTWDNIDTGNAIFTPGDTYQFTITAIDGITLEYGNIV